MFSQIRLDSVPTPRGVMLAVSVSDALEAGASVPDVHAAALAQASQHLSAIASSLRATLAPSDPAKLTEYQLKERVAAMPDAKRPESLMRSLRKEAEARGLKVEELMALITKRSGDLNGANLAIAAWEAEARAALMTTPAPDDPAQIEAVITAAFATHQARADALLAQLLKS